MNTFVNKFGNLYENEKNPLKDSVNIDSRRNGKLA